MHVRVYNKEVGKKHTLVAIEETALRADGRLDQLMP